MDKLIINSFLGFDCKTCRFFLSENARDMLYSKQAIYSNSGADEWCHHFFCELLDLYSGCSVYNYSINSYKHEDAISYYCKNGHYEEVVSWIDDHRGKIWFRDAAKAFGDVISRLPDEDERD